MLTSSDGLLERLDRAFAAIGLLITSPLIALAALGIRWLSPGPVLYRAQRAGRGGEPFTMFKLRTMHADAETGGRITGSGDPRIFPFGRWLRRLKIDELPQLANVVRGEMALVGPRPEDVTIVREHYTAMMWESLAVPPGVTSPGSLHYYGEEDALPSDPDAAERVYLERLLPRKIAIDLVYVRNRSLGYHVEILLRTGLGIVGLGWVFRGRSEWESAEAERILADRLAAGPADAEGSP